MLKSKIESPVRILSGVLVLACVAPLAWSQDKYSGKYPDKYSEGGSRYRPAESAGGLSDAQILEKQKAEYYNTKSQDPLQGASPTGYSSLSSGNVRRISIGSTGTSNRQGIQLSGTSKACAPGEAFIRRPGRFKATAALGQDQMGYCLPARCGSADRRVNAVTGDRGCVARVSTPAPAAVGGTAPTVTASLGAPTGIAPSSGGGVGMLCVEGGACVGGGYGFGLISGGKGEKDGVEKGDMSADEFALVQEKIGGMPESEQVAYLQKFYADKGYSSEESAAIADKRMVSLGFSAGSRGGSSGSKGSASSAGSTTGTTTGAGASAIGSGATAKGSDAGVVAQSPSTAGDSTGKTESREPASSPELTLGSEPTAEQK